MIGFEPPDKFGLRAMQTTEPDTLPMVAPGVRALIVEADGAHYVPLVFAPLAGRGHVAKWLDGLPPGTWIFSSVVNRQLEEMLVRRGYVRGKEWYEEEHEWVEVYTKVIRPK